MSWFNASQLSSFAKQALSQAQKSIDRVLDIQEEEPGAWAETIPYGDPGTAGPVGPLCPFPRERRPRSSPSRPGGRVCGPGLRALISASDQRRGGAPVRGQAPLHREGRAVRVFPRKPAQKGHWAAGGTLHWARRWVCSREPSHTRRGLRLLWALHL